MENSKMIIECQITKDFCQVFCQNTRCKYNLIDTGTLSCVLKIINIDSDGKCRNFEKEGER